MTVLQQEDYWIQASPLAHLGEYARTEGLDWDTFLSGFDLQDIEIADPDTTISAKTMIAVFQRFAEVSQNDAQIIDIFHGFPVGFAQGFDYLGIYAQSVRKGLSNWCRYSALRSNCLKIHYSEDEHFGKLEWSLPSSFSNYTQFSFVFLGWAISRTEMLLGDSECDIEIHIDSPRPNSVSTILEKYGGQVQYNQADHCVLVPSHLLDLSPGTTDPVLLRIVENHVQQVIDGRQTAASPLHQIIEVMCECMRAGNCSVDAVANRSELSRRTLQRIFEAHGTSYRSLLAKVRKTVAEQYLLETDMPLKEIAHLLGFSGMSTFSRAAKIWFGTSPKAIRSTSEKQSTAGT